MGTLVDARTRRSWGLLLLLVASSLVVTVGVYWLTAPPAEEWAKRAPAPVRGFEAASVVVGDELVLLGGFVDHPTASRSVHAYNVATDRWTALPDLPLPLTHLAAALHDDAIWVAGGFVGDDPGVATARVFRYGLADGQWSESLQLPAPRAGGLLASVAGRLHYAGGFGTDRDRTHDDHWAFDGTHWASRAPLPVARGHLSAAVLQGALYAAGGQVGHDTQPIDVPDVHRYDPEMDRWTSLAPLPAGHSHSEASTVVAQDRIAILGGRENQRFLGGAVDTIWTYSRSENRWEYQGSLPQPVFGAAAGVIGGQVVLVGGFGQEGQVFRAPWPNLKPAIHPDIVHVESVEGMAPAPGWTDSYSVGDACYCATTFDHGIAEVVVPTPAGPRTVRAVCELLGPGPGQEGYPLYNDVQCGNGPANSSPDEVACPGRVDLGIAGCGHIGPTWALHR